LQLPKYYIRGQSRAVTEGVGALKTQEWKM